MIELIDMLRLAHVVGAALTNAPKDSSMGEYYG